MDHFPIQIIIRIFSYLSSAQLLRVEQACRRWLRVIQENFWNQLECITEATIDYPNGDYLNNFIRLSAHVARVKQFIDPFALLKGRIPSCQDTEAELCVTTLDLVTKLSPDAQFPLDVIHNVVNFELKMKAQACKGSKVAKEHLKNRSIQAIIRATINYVVNLTPMREFRSLRINQLYVHSKEMDPFVIRWTGEEVPIPIESNKVTRLVVGCLVIRLAWDSQDLYEQGVSIYNRMSELKCLKVVDIETVRLSVYSQYDGQEPTFDIILEFHQDERRFSVDEFDSLLETLSGYSSVKRDLDVVQCIRNWRNEGRVKCAELRVAQVHFSKMDFALILKKDFPGLLDNPFQALIHQVVHSLVDVLHLTYEKNSTDADMLERLALEGVLSRLKALSISFAYGGTLQDGLQVWHVDRGVRQVRRILRRIKNNLGSLERLTLRFTAGGQRCPPSLFKSAGVNVESGSLPRLVSLDCIGLACFPFIASVVSQAPNLRRLSVRCQPFDDDKLGLEWILQLIEILDACPRLVFLQIAVRREEDVRNVGGKPSLQLKRRKQTKLVERDISKFWPLLNCIKERLRSLHQKRSNGSHLSVAFDTSEPL